MPCQRGSNPRSDGSLHAVAADTISKSPGSDCSYETSPASKIWLHDLGNESSLGSSSSSETGVETAPSLELQLASWLAKMELTSPRFLRATPAYRCGCAFFRERGSGSALASEQVKTISKFMSHSWQSNPFWKALGFWVASGSLAPLQLIFSHGRVDTVDGRNPAPL